MDQSFDQREVVLRLSNWMRRKCGLPEVTSEHVFTEMELYAILSFCAAAYNGMSQKPSQRLKWRRGDLEEYHKTGILPGWAIRVDSCLQEKSPHLASIPDSYFQAWKICLEETNAEAPSIGPEDLRFEKIIRPYVSYDRTKKALTRKVRALFL